MEIIKMSQKEIFRGEVILRVLDGKITQEEARFELGISLRQIKRMCKRCKEKGIAGLAHLRRGKPGNNKIPEKTRESIIELITDPDFEGFGPQLLSEQLKCKKGIRVSRESVRKIMITKGIWIVKRRKRGCYYQRRERRKHFGELIQIDGSYHDWFEGRGPKCCLINFVDDATGKIVEARFVEYESTISYLDCMKRHIKRYGIPLALYSDRHMIFTGIKHKSQFKRALEELGVKLIHANSPQAKGRVERVHGTLQDRLVKLMRLEKISSLEEANEYLKSFIVDYNNRFGKQPASEINAHRKLEDHMNLKKILCVKEVRKISKNLEVQFENQIYQIIPQNGFKRLEGKDVIIYSINGKVHIEYNSELLKYTLYSEQLSNIMDRKRIDAFLDRKDPCTIMKRQRKGISINF